MCEFELNAGLAKIKLILQLLLFFIENHILHVLVVLSLTNDVKGEDNINMLIKHSFLI